MIGSLPSLNGLRAFEAAARGGGFVAAAQELNVSPSAISRLVKVLEHRVGVALFNRLPNGLELTAAGAAYLQDLSASFDRIRAATQRLQSNASHSVLIGAGPTLAMRWLIPRLPRFQQVCPNVEVRLSTSIEDADPMKPDWTAAIRIGSGQWTGFEAEYLFTAEMFPVCLPSMASGLRKPADLAKARILQVANAPEDWAFWLKAARVSGVDLGRAQVFDYPAFALQAALDGLGVAMARAPFVADDLVAGRLARPFDLSVPKGRGWYLVSRPSQQGNPALHQFRNWLREELKRTSV
ncbi:MAG: LysR substrate-binding domain-containing protein [Micropepsaceae bacterium]